MDLGKHALPAALPVPGLRGAELCCEARSGASAAAAWAPAHRIPRPGTTAFIGKQRGERRTRLSVQRRTYTRLLLAASLGFAFSLRRRQSWREPRGTRAYPEVPPRVSTSPARWWPSSHVCKPGCERSKTGGGSEGQGASARFPSRHKAPFPVFHQD